MVTKYWTKTQLQQNDATWRVTIISMFITWMYSLDSPFYNTGTVACCETWVCLCFHYVVCIVSLILWIQLFNLTTKAFIKTCVLLLWFTSGTASSEKTHYLKFTRNLSNTEAAGFFAIYAGFMYNDFFSVGLQLFDTRWKEWRHATTATAGGKAEPVWIHFWNGPHHRS